MRFQWDEEKNRRNHLKHRVDFSVASLVFSDPLAVSRLHRVESGEERRQIIGSAGGGTVLVVAYTERKENGHEVIRIISARKASPRERKAYEESV